MNPRLSPWYDTYLYVLTTVFVRNVSALRTELAPPSTSASTT